MNWTIFRIKEALAKGKLVDDTTLLHDIIEEADQTEKYPGDPEPWEQEIALDDLDEDQDEQYDSASGSSWAKEISNYRKRGLRVLVVNSIQHDWTMGVVALKEERKWPNDYPYADGEGKPRQWAHAGEISQKGFAELVAAFGSGEVALCIGCAGGTTENPTGIVALIRATPENLAKAWFDLDEEELVEAGLSQRDGP